MRRKKRSPSTSRKSAFSDYDRHHGRANRHVGAIAENVTKALKETGIKNIHVEGMPNCDWVLIDPRRDRARIQAGGSRILQPRAVVDAEPGGGKGDQRVEPMRTG